MDCKETLERLSDYRDGSLSGTVADGISRHLGECAGCAEVQRSLDAVRKGLLDLPPVPAPPELLGRIREAIASEGGAASSSAGGPAADTPARSVFSRLKVPLETAAAVLLLSSAYWY
ncbi:MAG: zf-HC2 domain-containing protein, partial [Deltaproteobacteria bacterium]|nr:zf-HC2 domain-containing protein [Deltaproteobacteria bacterium]